MLVVERGGAPTPPSTSRSVAGRISRSRCAPGRMEREVRDLRRNDPLMAQYIYTMKKVRKAHGDKVVLDDVTLSFLPGAKIGVVGPNGAGKSSVLKIMAGLDHPNNGEAFSAPGASVGILQQEPPLNEEKTVLGNVQEGAGEVATKLVRYNEIAELMATDYSDELMEEMGRLQEDLDNADAWDLDSQLQQAMDALRCPPGDSPVTHLSGGERRRVALCKLLLSKPDLLLLDEPTNHLDAESVQWLEHHLANYEGAVLAVTHDRYFLDNVAEWILELDRGRAYPYEATTRRTSRRRPSASRSRAARTPSCASGSPTSSRGCAPGRRRGRPRASRVSPATRRWRPRRRRPASSTSMRSRSRRGRVWATWWSR